jgi:hypothetical protein
MGAFFIREDLLAASRQASGIGLQDHEKKPASDSLRAGFL